MQCPNHVERRKVARQQLVGIEIHEDRTVFPADDDWGDGAGNAPQHHAHVDAGQVLDVGLVEIGVRNRKDAEGQGAGRIERQHHGRERVGRQRRQGAQRERIDLRQRPVRVDFVAEVDLDDAHARDGTRFDEPGPGGLVDPALDAVGDGLFDRRGRHALVIGQHLNGRGLEDGQDIDRNCGHRQRAQHEHHEDQGGHHVWVAKRCLDKPHEIIPLNPHLRFIANRRMIPSVHGKTTPTNAGRRMAGH